MFIEEPRARAVTTPASTHLESQNKYKRDSPEKKLKQSKRSSKCFYCTWHSIQARFPE
jgi:hypothetical protein